MNAFGHQTRALFAALCNGLLPSSPLAHVSTMDENASVVALDK